MRFQRRVEIIAVGCMKMKIFNHVCFNLIVVVSWRCLLAVKTIKRSIRASRDAHLRTLHLDYKLNFETLNLDYKTK